MKKIISQLHSQEQSGFVLLFSLVVSAIIFFVGAGIFSITFKELIVSSLGKESQKAIFAADAGVECALYGDRSNVNAFSARGIPFSCFGKPVNPTLDRGAFKFQISFEDSSCAVVTVLKLSGGESSGTDIFAQGYNRCTGDNGPVLNYPGLTERVYRVKF